MFIMFVGAIKKMFKRRQPSKKIPRLGEHVPIAAAPAHDCLAHNITKSHQSWKSELRNMTFLG